LAVVLLVDRVQGKIAEGLNKEDIMNDAYPLAMSTDEIDRLRMQSDLFRRNADSMLTEVGVQPGWRCLDLCCGIGGITDLLSLHTGPDGECVGLDVDKTKLDVASKWAESLGLKNVHFVQGDAFETGLEPQSFDLVHTRFALGIVPNGTKIFDHALGLVRPGGVVFFEECDVDAYSCFPEHPLWNLALETVVSCFHHLGSDPMLGRKLYTMLHRAGATNIRVRPVRYALRSGEPMTYHLPLTLFAMRDTVVSLGLMKPEQLDKTVEALMKHLSAPATLSMPFTMVQTAAVI
jgi:ubiquinone/menaquinone biosynthesis C-methylase UbiE